MLVGGLLRHVLPGRSSSWARAMQSEIEQIEGDRAALLFALGCLWAACREAALQPSSPPAGNDATMHQPTSLLRDPLKIGIASAIAATALGILYLALAGAPLRYLVVNATALVLGLVALPAIARAGLMTGRFAGHIVLALGVAILATAVFGTPADGAARWIWVGPLGVQTGLVLLPLMVVAYAGRSDAIGTAGIVLAAAALAIQPDRALAGVLAAGLATLMVVHARPSPGSGLGVRARRPSP